MKTATLFATLALLLLLTGCGEAPPVTPTPANLAGTWTTSYPNEHFDIVHTSVMKLDPSGKCTKHSWGLSESKTKTSWDLTSEGLRFKFMSGAGKEIEDIWRISSFNGTDLVLTKPKHVKTWTRTDNPPVPPEQPLQGLPRRR